jgi:hypothetical protein
VNKTVKILNKVTMLVAIIAMLLGSFATTPTQTASANETDPPTEKTSDTNKTEESLTIATYGDDPAAIHSNEGPAAIHSNEGPTAIHSNEGPTAIQSNAGPAAIQSNAGITARFRTTAGYNVPGAQVRIYRNGVHIETQVTNAYGQIRSYYAYPSGATITLTLHLQPVWNVYYSSISSRRMPTTTGSYVNFGILRTNTCVWNRIIRNFACS